MNLNTTIETTGISLSSLIQKDQKISVFYHEKNVLIQNFQTP